MPGADLRRLSVDLMDCTFLLLFVARVPGCLRTDGVSLGESDSGVMFMQTEIAIGLGRANTSPSVGENNISQSFLSF